MEFYNFLTTKIKNNFLIGKKFSHIQKSGLNPFIFVCKLTNGVTGNTSDSGSEESWFKSRLVNCS